MATMLEERTTEEKHSVVYILVAEGLNVMDIHTEMFPVYGGKCLLHKAVHNWVEKFSHGHSIVTDHEMEVAETTVKDFYAAGFNTLVKRWDKCINVGGGYVEK
jgi:hypothetical protein